MAVATNRDAWVYDFDVTTLRNKVLFFADTYNDLMDRGEEPDNPVVKWSRDLRNEFRRGRRIVYSEANRTESLYRPFVEKHHFADFTMNDVLTKNHYAMFGADLLQPNVVMNFCVNGRHFYVLAANKLTDLHFTGDTQCLPLYRYTPDGQRVSNITDWGLRQFREHYDDDAITPEDVFAYVYAMLHDPAYRQKFEIDLRREFPRVYFQPDFPWWAAKGRELLDLHLNFQTADPYPLERNDVGANNHSPPPHGSPLLDASPSPDAPTPKPILRADRDRNRIILDDQTTLSGIPNEAWWYELGSRSALEWVLDQYKEKKPRDPTIAARFNTYRFADHKEQVIDLLQRICTVSVQTYRITDYELDRWTEIDPDEGLEFRPEFEMDLIEESSLANPKMPIEEVLRRLGLD